MMSEANKGKHPGRKTRWKPVASLSHVASSSKPSVRAKAFLSALVVTFAPGFHLLLLSLPLISAACLSVGSLRHASLLSSLRSHPLLPLGLPSHSSLYACLLTNGRGRCSPRCSTREAARAKTLNQRLGDLPSTSHFSFLRDRPLERSAGAPVEQRQTRRHARLTSRGSIVALPVARRLETRASFQQQREILCILETAGEGLTAITVNKQCVSVLQKYYESWIPT